MLMREKRDIIKKFNKRVYNNKKIVRRIYEINKFY